MLFSEGRDPEEDLRLLIGATREALAATNLDDVSGRLWEIASQGAPLAMMPHLRRGALPAAAFELAAAAAALGSSKSYSVRPIWTAAFELTQGEVGEAPDDAPAVLGDEDYAELAALLRDGVAEERVEQLRRKFLEVAEQKASGVREEIAVMRATMESEGEAARVVCGPRIIELTRELAGLTGHSGPRPTDPELARAVDRAAPLGAGDDLLECMGDRPVLHLNRACGPAWEGLTLAIDAACGGSHHALERLGRFAQAHEALAWPLWLDEVCCLLAGHARADEARRRLDERLAGDPPDRVTARTSIALSRSSLEGAELRAAQDAWLRVSGAERSARAPIGAEPLSSSERERAGRAARQGDVRAQVVLGMERTLLEVDAAMRAEEESEGPFHSTRRSVLLRVEDAIEPAIGALLDGFRDIYARELARGALAALS